MANVVKFAYNNSAVLRFETSNGDCTRVPRILVVVLWVSAGTAPPRRPSASVAVIMLRQTALRATVLPRTALSRLAARPLCMHDDFKPKIKSYAGDDGDVHAQVRHRRLLVGSMHGLGGPVRAHRSPRTWRRTRWWSS